MSQIKSVIDFIVNSALTFYNTFRTYGGVWYALVITCAFILPMLNRIVAKLRGVK